MTPAHTTAPPAKQYPYTCRNHGVQLANSRPVYAALFATQAKKKNLGQKRRRRQSTLTTRKVMAIAKALQFSGRYVIKIFNLPNHFFARLKRPEEITEITLVKPGAEIFLYAEGGFGGTRTCKQGPKLGKTRKPGRKTRKPETALRNQNLPFSLQIFDPFKHFPFTTLCASPSKIPKHRSA